VAAYVGDTVALRADVTDPFSGEVLPDYDVLGDIYTSGVNPKTTPEIREQAEVKDVAFTWNPLIGDSGAYVGFVDTDGFPPGTIYVRIRVTGPVYDNVEFGSFRLTA
jgi:hypothetical protein